MTTKTSHTNSLASFVIPVIVALVFLCSPALAMASAGKILFVIGAGSVLSADGNELKAERGMEVYEGDTLRTTANGQMQVRMADGGLIAVRPSSEFKVDAFVYEDNTETDKTFFSLVKGGFRSVTGAIGEANKAAYKVDTPVATIGIRGTDYTARLCESNCSTENGLYIGVMSGGVVLTNDSGSIDLDASEYGFVQDIETQPEVMDEAPGDVLFSNAGGGSSTVAKATDNDDVVNNESATGSESVVASSTGTTDSGGAVDFNNVESTTQITVEEPAQELVNNDSGSQDADQVVEEIVQTDNETVADDTPVQPTLYRQISAVGYNFSPESSQELSESVIYSTESDVNTFSVTTSSGSVHDYSRDTAIAAVDTGSTTNNEISWGRWVNMNLTATDGSGTNTVMLNNQDSVHWAVSNEYENVTLPSTGVFNYAVVGGTSPTDNFGDTGAIHNSSQLATVDFQNHSANLLLNLTGFTDPEDAAQQYDWQLKYAMAIDPGTGALNGNLTDFNAYSAAGGQVHPFYTANELSGIALGSFAGFTEAGAPTAAAISYEANTQYTGYMSGDPINYQIRGVIAAELQP